MSFLGFWHSLFKMNILVLSAGKFKPVIKKAMVELEGQEAELWTDTLQCY